ncbi:hypothetical protein Hdeb2414_s0012g00393611 [Helianthus debilis subsp. tardiflorus]
MITECNFTISSFLLSSLDSHFMNVGTRKHGYMGSATPTHTQKYMYSNYS